MTSPDSFPSVHQADALDNIRARFGFNPQHVREFRNALYKRSLGLDYALQLLPAAVQAEWTSLIGPPDLTLVSRLDSTLDGASKLVMRTRQALLLETVILRIQSGRTSVCVSSQVGCAAKCSFCATGQMKMARSLSVPEILQQVVQAQEILRGEHRLLRNVVFMGMGEPMHNRPAVTQAIVRLVDSKWFNLSENHILVSTVGVLDEMLSFAREVPKVNLALSLHAARQEVRESIMPLAKQAPIAELRRVLAEIEQVRRRPLMVEYLLLDQVNDGPADLAALVDFCQGLQVHINLIPYNPIPARDFDERSAFVPTPVARQREFAAALKERGLRVTTRVSLGNDIAAACGQLVRQESLAQLRLARHAE